MRLFVFKQLLLANGVDFEALAVQNEKHRIIIKTTED